MLRMKIVLAAVGGILIGMWRLGAFFGSILYGGPAGMVTFGLIGF